jgi:hypothetical protein
VKGLKSMLPQQNVLYRLFISPRSLSKNSARSEGEWEAKTKSLLPEKWRSARATG